MNSPDLDALRPWLDRRDNAAEVLSPVPAQCLAATLDLDPAAQPGTVLPPLWQWLHFLDRTPSALLASDGEGEAALGRVEVGATAECKLNLVTEGCRRGGVVEGPGHRLAAI